MDAYNKFIVIQDLTKAIADAYEQVAKHEVFEKHERFDIVKSVLVDTICRISKEEADKIDDTVMPAQAKSYKMLISAIVNELQTYLGIIEPHYNFLKMRFEKVQHAADTLRTKVKKQGKIARDYKDTPAARLRAFRESLGLNQAEFAEKLNRTQTRISRMESGADGISRDMAKAIERVFGLDHKTLL